MQGSQLKINNKGGFMYLEKTLSMDEKIIKVVKLHFFTFIIPGLFLLLGLGMLNGSLPFLGIVIAVISIINILIKICIEMVITNKRVIIKKGVLSANTDELKLEKIESVSINKSLFGMIFNYGSVFFSGTGTTKVKFVFVVDPIAVKKVVEDTIEEYQKKLTQKN